MASLQSVHRQQRNTEEQRGQEQKWIYCIWHILMLLMALYVDYSHLGSNLVMYFMGQYSYPLPQ